jgi:hypothetical protein
VGLGGHARVGDETRQKQVQGGRRKQGRIVSPVTGRPSKELVRCLEAIDKPLCVYIIVGLLSSCHGH